MGIKKAGNRLSPFFKYIKYANQLSPHIVLLQFLSAITTTLYRFAVIAFLAMMIDIFGKSRFEIQSIMICMCWFLTGLFIITVLNRTLIIFAKSGDQLVNVNATSKLSKKMLSVDYATFINPEFRKLYSATKTGFTYTGGFRIFISETINEIVNFVATLILSGSILISTLTAKSSGRSHLAEFSNSWLYLILLGGLVTIPIILSLKLTEISGKIMQRFFQVNIQFNRVLDYFEEVVFKNLSVGKLLRIYDPDERLVTVVKEKIDSQMKEDTTFQTKASAVDGLSNIVNGGIVGILYTIISIKWLAGAISIGMVVASVGYLQQVIQALSLLFSAWGNRAASFTTMTQFIKFVEYPTRSLVDKGKSTLSPKTISRNWVIRFCNVSYRYPKESRWALHNVNLTINSGDRLAIVGQNGSGKTTLIKLLIRLIEPSSGQILLNGQNIQRFTITDYQRLISVVFQDYQLFPVSVLENITAMQNPDRARAKEALEIAGLTDRILKMKNGVDTKLFKQFDGDSADLSGGESQKLAIARAWYRNSPITVLDEPTASLDPIAEHEIYARFNQLIGNKTAVFISHRMSSVRFADLVVVLDKGEVKERGTHQALMESNGLYYQLFMAQAKYYQPSADI